eukprot:2196990-Rhodomonas_salina.5
MCHPFPASVPVLRECWVVPTRRPIQHTVENALDPTVELYWLALASALLVAACPRSVPDMA